VTLEEGTNTRPQKGGQRTTNDGARYIRRTELSTAPLREPENLHLQKCRVLGGHGRWPDLINNTAHCCGL